MADQPIALPGFGNVLRPAALSRRACKLQNLTTSHARMYLCPFAGRGGRKGSEPNHETKCSQGQDCGTYKNQGLGVHLDSFCQSEGMTSTSMYTTGIPVTKQKRSRSRPSFFNPQGTCPRGGRFRPTDDPRARFGACRRLFPAALVPYRCRARQP